MTNFVSGTTRYVSHTGSDTAPYTSWASASPDLQKVINYCTPWDTVIIDRGNYFGNNEITVPLVILGVSRDSTILRHGEAVGGVWIILNSLDSLIVKNLTIISNGEINHNPIINKESYLEVDGCNIYEGRTCIFTYESDVIIRNCFFKINEDKALSLGAFLADDFYGIIENNVFMCRSDAEVLDDNLNRTIFTNNIVNSFTSVGSNLLAFWKREYFEITNNIIYGDALAIAYFYDCDTVLVRQNTFIPSLGGFFGTGNVGRIYIFHNQVANIYNNIFYSSTGIEKDYIDSTPYVSYNLFYKHIGYIVTGQVEVGPGNIIEKSPMFVNDSLFYNLDLTYDVHLQHGSPAIDAGNPDVLDVDGSRSDIGFYGGPFGESYKYPDLSPKSVRLDSIAYEEDNTLVKLWWEKNTESDLWRYNIYRGLDSNFTPNTSSYVKSTDTTFAELLILDTQYKSYYYKILAEDKTNNLSECDSLFYLEITDSVVTKVKYITTKYDYNLNQNYPNPFNPLTVIGYTLKDEGFVRIKVYDTNGQFVETVESSLKSRGYHEIEFNGSNLASGIYIYRIEVIDDNRIPVFLDMGKMVLLK
ncbi:MAG: hypothetical protein SCALA702_00150 [Melioribacteraceae bacterium]|nr:MAG: hypothetical protein SCALA702_00150 [Melioribacteraceae bacterium]